MKLPEVNDGILTKNKQLDKLFERWKAKHALYKNNFRYDGIVNEEIFEKQSTKILFISKEPNGRNHQGRQTGDFRKEWNDNGAVYPFAYSIAYWAYGITENFPPFATIYDNYDTDNYKDTLRKIAFMDVKKSAGTGNSDPTIISEHVQNDKNEILNEIEIINPNLIILGLSFNEDARKALFGNIKWIDCDYKIEIANWNKIRIIDYYHPSIRAFGSLTYCLLQNVINSKKFKELSLY